MNECTSTDGVTVSAPTDIGVSVLCMPLRAPHAEMHALIERLSYNAQSQGLTESASDLGRIQLASARLQGMLDEVIGDALVAAEQNGVPLHTHPHLRHDLRTPINAIKGYGDMLLEDWQDADAQSLIAELRRVLTLADELLTLIDALPAAS